MNLAGILSEFSEYYILLSAQSSFSKEDETLYLASKKINGQLHYVIRESYREADLFLSRDLIDLGPDPVRYIVYPGGNAFYIDTQIEDQLLELGAGNQLHELENIFWRFVDPEIRRVLEPFRSREHRHRMQRKKHTSAEANTDTLHIFDKRRAHYLKFGQSDQRNLGRIPLKYFGSLLNKSRDEIEYTLMDMEDALNPREYKLYTFTIFNLQHFFYESFAKTQPQMLNQDRVDDFFLDRICRLNSDASFWAGMPTPDSDRLHRHLVRYILMHFDYDYAPGSLLEDYLRQFINSRRDYRPPYKSRAASLKAAGRILGESVDNLKKMNRREIARLYRRKAQKLHPDKGGDHDKFVKLTEAYHDLIRRK